MYDAFAIANDFLDLADRDGKPLTAMQIQKLVYLAHGFHLAIAGTLLKDTVEAWPYGPVIPRLYHCFKKFGNSRISERAHEITVEGDTFRTTTPSIDDYPDREKNMFVKSLIEKIWEVYGGMSGIELSKLTHQEGSPWAQTWAKDPDRMGKDIDDQVIKEYYLRELNANAATG